MLSPINDYEAAIEHLSLAKSTSGDYKCYENRSLDSFNSETPFIR